MWAMPNCTTRKSPTCGYGRLNQATLTGNTLAKIIDQLVDYILAAPEASSPSEVVQKAKNHLDTLAAIVSGSQLTFGARSWSRCWAMTGSIGYLMLLGPSRG